MSKKLLLITYYWPPAGGVAVRRWLQMTYHLANLGWNITVYHPKNPAYPAIDESNQKWIHPNIKFISRSIKEPGNIYAYLNKSKKNGSAEIFKDNKSWLKTTALKIRANQFIPDARAFWIKPSIKYLTKHLRQNQTDIIITNGTPHSCHLIGLGLKQTFTSIKWVADFRDPWMEIDYFEDLLLSKKAEKKHESLEQQVLKTADATTTVSPSWATLFKTKGAKNTKVFTNGFSIKMDEGSSRESTSTITIVHAGTLDADRNPKNLWEAINHTDLELKINLVGPIAQAVLEDTNKIDCVITRPVTIPHVEAINIMKSSSALLLLNNRKGETKGRIPAKVFEYLALGKPIIYFGQLKNDAVDILKQSGLAKFYTYDDRINIEELTTWIKKEKHLNNAFVSQFSRENIAKQYNQFLNSL